MTHCVCVIRRSEFKSLDNARLSTERLVASEDAAYRDQRTSGHKRSMSGPAASGPSARAAPPTAAPSIPAARATPPRLAKSVSARRAVEVRVPVLTMMPPTIADGGAAAPSLPGCLPSKLSKAADRPPLSGRSSGMPPRSLSQRPMNRRPTSASTQSKPAAQARPAPTKPEDAESETVSDSVTLPVLVGTKRLN